MATLPKTSQTVALNLRHLLYLVSSGSAYNMYANSPLNVRR
ncbi:hypothetical protein [Streptomyces brevispora]